jgi:cyclopropane fatty-acyl-phospholipid synthase-like methyltransferase
MPSYNLQTISNTAHAEVQRLQAQVNLFWAAELEVFDLIGVQDQMRILEVGCSFGAYTKKLLQQYPNSSMVSIDIDASAVESTRAMVLQASAADRAAVRHQAVELLDDMSQFDLVIARLVVEHLDDPALAFDRMLQALVPNGLLICISNDFGWHTLHTPDITELPKLYDAYRQARIAQGGHPTIGRDLPMLFHGAGFTDVRLRAVIAHSDIDGLANFRASEGTGIAMQLVTDGYLGAADLAAIVAASPNSKRCVRDLLVGSGRRPK